jgi:membrane-bound lytic murein transglycosylase B
VTEATMENMDGHGGKRPQRPAGLSDQQQKPIRSTAPMLKNAVAAIAVAIGMWPLAAAQEPAAPPSFDEFLAGVRAEALSRGISAATLDAALADVKAPEPVVVARDRAQPELTQSLDQYVAQRLTTRTITTARKMLAEHRPLLRKVERTYGVSAPLMVAIWGLESNFGRFTGTYPTIQALATLAYDNRRPLFRRELFEALQIVEKGVIAPAELKGSWAGAMGQPQFMPSSYLRHAVDFDGDDRADIWSSQADVFGSMANYLKNAGWREGERWGREVRLTKSVMARVDRAVPMRSSGCRAIRELTTKRPLAEWKRLGVTLPGGGPLPSADMDASLVRGQKRHFLVYANYEAILDYNCSNSYAVSVGVLADRIW